MGSQSSSEVLAIGNSRRSWALSGKYRFCGCHRRLEKVRYRLSFVTSRENEILKIRMWTGEGIGDRSGMMVGCIWECFAVLRRVWVDLKWTSWLDFLKLTFWFGRFWRKIMKHSFGMHHDQEAKEAAFGASKPCTAGSSSVSQINFYERNLRFINFVVILTK